LFEKLLKMLLIFVLIFQLHEDFVLLLLFPQRPEFLWNSYLNCKVTDAGNSDVPDMLEPILKLLEIINLIHKSEASDNRYASNHETYFLVLLLNAGEVT